ncbi:hypothetical protein [Pseudooceanicola sp.]|uniref:hypothetical protein n=1 Tax=Pseudooceanicola sp. TaxID=1914328 RepID=UPI0035191D78
MPLKQRRSPQEKKQLSLSKDRRNNHGESDKGPRKSIPLQKKLANRKVRRVGQIGYMDEEERAISVAIQKSKNRWKKFSDGSLADHIKHRQARKG